MKNSPLQLQNTVNPHRLFSRPAVLTLSCLALITSGCASSLLNLSAPSEFGSKLAEMVGKERPRLVDNEEDNDFDTKLETPLLRDYISVTGNNMIALRGVGLVTGLDGTGGDPPPSHLRKSLQDEMSRRNIPNPGRILASRNTALVMITAYLPAMVRDGQKFDVRVTLPPNSEATSLKGGWLLETRLSEEQTVAGKGNIKGHEYAVAHGAILTALGSGGNTRDAPAMLRRGSIPGGAVSKTERNLEIILRNDFRGFKTSQRIENAISSRLHHYNNYGQRIPMAEAKTDIMLELMVHPLYRNNFPRYQQMIRSIALKETPVARRMRIEKLSRDILEPSKAAATALQLEAIGRDAIPFLQAALLSTDLEVRFHAAQSLAYLEDSSGVEVLKQAAIEEPAFRVYSLAALSVVADADGVIAMRELLGTKDLETRYGAVRALKENNPGDHALGTKEFANQFVLHAIDSDGPPAAHVVRYRAPEIVVFGTHQELQLPCFLKAGNNIQIIGKAGDDKVTISRHAINEQDTRRRVSSTNLIEIIETIAALGANYPDVVQMMLEAEKQHNLAGELGIDRLPQAGRMFKRGFGESGSRAKLGTPSLTPGLFDRVDESEREQEPEDKSGLARMFSMAPDTEDDQEEMQPNFDPAGLSEPPLMEVDEEATPMNFQGLNLSEQADEMSDSEGIVEKVEFKEPMGAKMRRIFFSPFQKQE